MSEPKSNLYTKPLSPQQIAFETWATTDPLARSWFYTKFGDDDVIPLGDLTAYWIAKDMSGDYWDDKVQTAWMGWKASSDEFAKASEKAVAWMNKNDPEDIVVNGLKSYRDHPEDYTIPLVMASESDEDIAMGGSS